MVFFDNGQGELSDAAAALDWDRKTKILIIVMSVLWFYWIINLYAIDYERPEVNNFIAVSPQPNVYDFSF